MSLHGVSLAAVVAATLAVYLTTLAPGITWRHAGDGAELAAAAYRLGIAHPPGYPLYLLIGHVFTWLPFGEVATRLNLLSAVAASGAVLVAVLLGRELARHDDLAGRLGALTGALALGFSPTFWSQAVIAEVYTLSVLLVALALWALIHRRRTDWPGLPVGGALIGLAASQHLTALLLIPVALVLLWGGRPAGSRRTFGFTLAALVLGLVAPYAYVVVRAGAVPLLNWGDPATPARLWWLVSAEQYRGMALGLPPAAILQRLVAWPGQIAHEFTPVGLILGVAGGWTLWQARRREAAALLVLAGGALLWSAAYAGSASNEHLLPSYLVFGVWIGVGAAGALQWVAKALGSRGAAGSAMAGVGLFGLALGLPVALALTQASAVDVSGDQAARGYAAAVFDALPREALLVARGTDQTFSLWYLQSVEGRRADVLVVNDELLFWRWYRDNLRRLDPGLVLRPVERDGYPLAWLIADQLGHRPVFATSPEVGIPAGAPPAGSEARSRPPFQLLAHGPVFELTGEARHGE